MTEYLIIFADIKLKFIRMKILMVLTSHFPPDSRVEKEAISLAEAGHELHILCYAKDQEPLYEKYNQFTVHRFKANHSFKNKISALALIFPLYFSVWKKQMLKLHKKYNFDAYHIHDLPLSKTGYYFKRRYGTKLICDQHEFYSNWIIKTAHMNTPLGKMVGFMSKWEKYERKYLSLSDMVITVAEPLRENYIEKYGLNQNKLITVPNTPSKKIYNTNNIDNRILENFKSDFIIFYAGGIDILRGIDTAIVALKQIKKEIPNVKLLLCGRIVKPYDPFETAKKYDVQDLIIFKGWIDENEIPSYIAASDVCFFTPPANRDEINKTIATKIYQYAIMNKPVIVSEAKMMKEFVEENNLGISIHSQNADEFYKAVIKIYNNEIAFKKMKDDSWIWENTVKPLISKYNSLHNQKTN